MILPLGALSALASASERLSVHCVAVRRLYAGTDAYLLHLQYWSACCARASWDVLLLHLGLPRPTLDVFTFGDAYTGHGSLHEYTVSDMNVYRKKLARLPQRASRPWPPLAAARPGLMAPRSASMALCTSFGAGRASWRAGQARLPLRRRRKGNVCRGAEQNVSAMSAEAIGSWS